MGGCNTIMLVDSIGLLSHEKGDYLEFQKWCSQFKKPYYMRGTVALQQLWRDSSSLYGWKMWKHWRWTGPGITFQKKLFIYLFFKPKFFTIKSIQEGKKSDFMGPRKSKISEFQPKVSKFSNIDFFDHSSLTESNK